MNNRSKAIFVVLSIVLIFGVVYQLSNTNSGNSNSSASTSAVEKNRIYI